MSEKATITPEQREAARLALMPHVAWGQGTIQADLDAAIDALMAAGYRAGIKAAINICEEKAGDLASEGSHFTADHVVDIVGDLRALADKPEGAA